MLRNYLLTAYKVFMRRKLFTAINLACIVLTLVVLMVITALLETAFFPSGVEGRSERMLQVIMVRRDSPDGHSRSNNPLGYKLIDKYLKPLAGAQPGVERVSATMMPTPVSVYQGERVSELQMRHTDADYWKILDFKPLAGRLLNEIDDRAGRPAVVVNRSTANKLFPGAPAAALGQKIDIGGRNYQIVGVVEDTLHLNAFADIWAPISSQASSDYRNKLTGGFFALILARQRGDIPRIQREVERIAAGVVTEDPAKWKTVRFWADSKLDIFARLTVGSDEQLDSGATKLLAMVGGAMLLFMLLPALNLVNLNAGRILERRAEIGVRKAFGATSAQLAAQFVVENILLCLAGGLLALAATAGVLVLIENAKLLPYLKVDMNLAVFGCGLLISTVFGLLSGVLPAWRMARLDPVHALKGAV